MPWALCEKVETMSASSSDSGSDEGLDVAWFGAFLCPFDRAKRCLLWSSRRGMPLGMDTTFDHGKKLEWRRPGRMRLRPEQQRKIWWRQERGAPRRVDGRLEIWAEAYNKQF